MFDNKILSEGITDIIYHYTSLENFLSIVKNNEFVLRASNLTKTSEYNNNGYYYYFSTTRGKNGDEGYGKAFEGTVRITLDGRKLSQRYKGQPFDYWGPSWEKNTKNHEYDEMEDRILSNEPVIKNAIDYIIRADIFFGLNNQIEGIRSRIENAKQQGKSQIVTSLEHRLTDIKKRYDIERLSIRHILSYLMNYRKENCLYIYSSEKDFINQTNNFDDVSNIRNDYTIELPQSGRKYLFVAVSFVSLIAMANKTESNEDIAKIYKMLGYDEYLNGTNIKRVKYFLSQGLDYIIDNIFNNESSSDPKFSKMTGSFTKYLRTHKFKNLNQFIEFIKNVNMQQYMTVNESLLKEGKEINSLINAFVNKNPNINPKDLEQLFTADPTTVQNSRGTFAGKYCTWIGNQYVNGKLKVGDITELRKALNIYNINKSQITTPINNIPSLSDLITIISDYTDDFKASRQLSKGEQELEKVYEDAEWVVYIPHTYAASRKIGGDTHWCTASSNDYYYNDYTSSGPLYVNIHKSDGAKFQFHFPRRQFMDSDDNRISIKKIGLSKGLIEFYGKIEPRFHLYMKYDIVSNQKNNMGWIGVSLDNKWNMIDDKENLISPNQWFDGISSFSDKRYAPQIIIVTLNEKKNIINNKRKYISQKWYDDVAFFGNAMNKDFIVSLNNKQNIINRDGNYIYKKWFDKISPFCSDYAQNTYYKVKINNKYNIIGPDLGKFLINIWVDEIDDYQNDCAVITLNGKENLLLRYKDKQLHALFKPISDIWFDEIEYFHMDLKYTTVRLNDKWNLINKKGELAFKEWFDAIYEYRNDYVVGKLNRKDGVFDIPNSNENINENKIQVAKSDIKNMIMECVNKVIKKIYKDK